MYFQYSNGTLEMVPTSGGMTVYVIIIMAAALMNTDAMQVLLHRRPGWRRLEYYRLPSKLPYDCW